VGLLSQHELLSRHNYYKTLRTITLQTQSEPPPPCHRSSKTTSNQRKMRPSCVCSRPLSKNQETRSPTSTLQPLRGRRRLMPQTPNSVPHIEVCDTPPHPKKGARERACLRPLVNTPNRIDTLGRCHGVCSLERR